MVAAEIDKTQETFFSELPVGWRYDRLKDIVSLRNDKTSDKSSEQNYLELEDIEQGTGNLLSKKNTLDVESAVIRFKKGDVLFGKLRPYLEKYYYADFDGKCTGEILAFYPRGIQGHFLRYCVAAPWFIGKCNALAYGAKMPRVNWPKQLALFDIPIPSNSEQQRIATYLDKTCAAIDKTIGVKQKQLEILDALRKSIIHKAVTSGLDDSVELKDSGVEWLGRIPKHWDVVKLKYEVEVKDGTHDTPPYALDAESNYPFVTSKDIIDNKIDFSATKYISKKYHQSFNRRSDVKKGDIIMPMIGTLGNAAIVKTDKSFSIKNVALFKTSKSSRINTKYLFYFIESEINKRQFFLLSKGGVQSFLSLTILRNLYLIKPHLKEQKKIATWLDNINKQINDLKKNIQQQISTLEQYRKSLIHECVTGKRRSAG